jgi:hypothetical protein
MRTVHGPALTYTLAAFASRLPATLLALLVALLVGSTVALRPDELDDDIQAMRDLAKAGEEKEDECIAKMALVRAGRDPRAFAAHKELIASKSDKIACAAIRGLAVTWHDPEYFRWLVGRVEDKSYYERKGGRPELYKCVLESIGTYPPDRVKAALKPLGDAVNRFLTTEPEYTDRAIRSYGTVPDRFTVQQLLEWLGQANSPGGGQAGEPESKEARASKDAAKKSILETLAQLCGKEFGDLDQWKKWWDENGKTFKFPEVVQPAAPGAARPAAPSADPSTLTEFRDEVYGFVVKKPDGEGWKFFKPDYDGPRVGLLCMQPGSATYNLARVYFSVHNPARAEPKDIKSFVGWVLNTAFKEQLPPDDMLKEPETKEMSLSGVDWTVVIGKGAAAGPKAGWGTMERRFYLAKLDTYILYVDAYVRLGADYDVKTALWNCVETMTLPAKK